ncbi:MAG: ribonuclease III [bacterium]|nr:ribonuclease III [bacterium]
MPDSNSSTAAEIDPESERADSIRSWLGKIIDGFRKPIESNLEEKRELLKFQERLKYKFKRPELLVHALTHRSFAYQEGHNRTHSNERLEFLGDAVLGLLINEALISQFEDANEGRLTKVKSLLVSRVVLAQVGKSLGLGDVIRISDNEAESGGRDRDSIISDAVEAILGAIYLDSGLDAARQLIHGSLLSRQEEFLSDASTRNYKSLLQEMVQAKFKMPPRYRIGATFGPDHSKDFMVEVLIRGDVVGSGRGRSKKDAEQDAARVALDMFSVEDEKLIEEREEQTEE